MIPNLFPSMTEESLESCIIRGYNGLEQYAHKFWLNHTLAYLKEGGFEDIGTSAHLLKALQKFASFSIEDLSLSPSGSSDSTSHSQLVNESDNQLLALNQFPELHTLFKQVLAFRKKLKQAEDKSETAECE